MREKIFKTKDPESMIHDEDKTVEEDSPIYSQDTQEYMHWHYRLNHPTHTVMMKMAKQKMLPRRITKILTDMGKLQIKAPMCNDCCGAKATRRPWRYKVSIYNQSHIKRPTQPGEVISVDQLESSIPSFIGQMTGRLTKQCIVGSTIFVDHACDLSYVYHQTSMTSEETLKSKLAFEKFALSHGVHIKHYHADNGRFKDTLFNRDNEEKGQTISYCGVGAHHQNGIVEKRIGDLQRTATALLLHAQRRWPDAINTHLWTYAIRAANDSRNYAPTNEHDTSPMSRFCATSSVPTIQNQQYSSRHALNVSLILNLQSGLVSPQYHCQYDDLFETTTGTQERSIPTSQWQYKAGLSSGKPELTEEEQAYEDMWDEQSY
jgi:hypothetical protein